MPSHPYSSTTTFPGPPLRRPDATLATNNPSTHSISSSFTPSSSSRVASSSPAMVPSSSATSLEQALILGQQLLDSTIDDASSDGMSLFDSSESSPNLSSFNGSHRRGSETSISSGEWTEASTDLDYDNESLSVKDTSGMDAIESLGRSAEALLEQLEASKPAAVVAGTMTPPRRSLSDDDQVAPSATRWSPLGNSPVEGPSTYEATRRRKYHNNTTGKTLATSTSLLTIRPSALEQTSAAAAEAHVRSASFTKTDLIDLDIESILDAYGDDFDRAQEDHLATLEEQRRAEEERERRAALLVSHEDRTPRSIVKRNYFPSPPTRTKSSPSVVQRQLFPSTSSLNLAATPALPRFQPREPTAADARPYDNLFPSHRVSPFPTKKKSSTSLASSVRSTSPFAFLDGPPPPPIPTPSRNLPFPSATLPPNLSSSPPSSRRSLARASTYSSASDASSPTSMRSSYQSTAASSSSFRWSVSTSSTAPTIAEESDYGGSRRGSLAPSCYSVASSSSPPSRRPSIKTSAPPPTDIMDWRTFAEELESEPIPDEDFVAATERNLALLTANKLKSSPSMHSLKSSRSLKSSPRRHHHGSRTTPGELGVPALPRKLSSFSLKGLRSTSTINVANPPPVPGRSSSLHKVPTLKETSK